MLKSASIRTTTFFLGISIISRLGFAQIVGSPFIETYNARDYNASVSNFDIEQDSIGRLYFGNWSGILRFDGSKWKKINISHGKSAYDLAKANDGLIYATTIDAIGYLTTDSIGNDKFITINSNRQDLYHNEVSGVLAAGSDVFFITDKYLLRYNKKEGLRKTANSGDITYTGNFHFRGENVFTFNGRLYLNKEDHGLFYLKNDMLIPVEGGKQTIGKTVVGAADVPNGKFLITDKAETFLLSESLQPYSIFSEELKNELTANRINAIDAKKTGSSFSLAIGTLKNGVYYTKQGDLIFHVNQFNGLSNNEVREVKFNSNCLWVATQSGISKLTGMEHFTYWNTENKDIGLIWELYKKDGVLYIPTTKALYVKRNNRLEKMGASTQRAYSLYNLNDQIFLNTENGINKISGNDIEPLFDLQIANNAVHYDDNIFVMSRRGLYRIPIKNNNLEKMVPVSNIVSGHSFSAQKYDGALWFSVVNSGIIKIWKEQDEYKVFNFTTDHGLPDDTSIEFINVEDELIIATNNGFYHINRSFNLDSTKIFVPHTDLIKERIEISYPAKDLKGNIWFVVNPPGQLNRLEKLEKMGDGSYIRVYLPFRLLNDQELTTIYPDPEVDNIIWIAGTGGLYRYDESHSPSSSYHPAIFLDKIAVDDSIIFNGAYMQDNAAQIYVPEFDNDNNHIEFNFVATSYEAPELTQYSYFLEGFDKSWSAWNSERKKEYTNLSPGKYTFNVKAKDLRLNETGVAKYSFIIEKPWYFKTWAIILIILLIALLIRLIVYAYTYRLRLQRKNLEYAVRQTTAEILLQKKQIETQNDSLKQYSQELKIHRDEILVKNDQLEHQQHEIRSQNDELRKLNATKDKFFSIIGHDLKGPVNSLMSFSGLLKNHAEHISKDEIRMIAGDLDKSLKNTYSLLDNLLEWSLSQTNQIDYNFELFDITELINENLDLFESQAKNKNITIETNIFSLNVWADKNCVNTVIRNLLSNAIKFTRERGEVKISVKELKGEVIISVADNGIGMDKETTQNIFSLDKKTGSLGTAKEKGTGLGLILCKEFVGKNNGRIWARSEEGKGTIFSFSLPGDKKLQQTPT